MNYAMYKYITGCSDHGRHYSYYAVYKKNNEYFKTECYSLPVLYEVLKEYTDITDINIMMESK